jgi:CRP-like cAMP-binding protein
MDAQEVAALIGSLSLFADLSDPEIEAVTHTFEEETFAEGQRILRQGFGGTNFYVILQGEAAVVIDGEEKRRMGKGDFFGEISILLDEPPTADVVAITELRCIGLPRDELVDWLKARPTVALRMLQTEARRLRTARR